MSLKHTFVGLVTTLLIAGATTSVVAGPASADTTGVASGNVTASTTTEAAQVEAKKGHWQWANARYWFWDVLSMAPAYYSCHSWGKYGVEKGWWPKYQCRLKVMHYSLYEWVK
jgi:hypothetical protein